MSKSLRFIPEVCTQELILFRRQATARNATGKTQAYRCFLKYNSQHFSKKQQTVTRFISIIVQRDAKQSSLFIILQVHSTCFGCQPHPSSGLHKTVNTASGTGHIFCAATSLRCDLTWPRCREVAAPVPEAVVSVLCTPDDGCG